MDGSKGEKPAYEVVRCLFCLTGREQQVIDEINASGIARAIFPQKVKRLRTRGVFQELSVPLFPGYVFVYSDTALHPASIAKVQDGLRILRYGDDSDGALVGADRAFADLLWSQDGLIGVMKAVRVGECVEIVDGFFKAFKGRVIAMDKRRQTVKVELDVVGSVRTIWLPFDYMN